MLSACVLGPERCRESEAGPGVHGLGEGVMDGRAGVVLDGLS